MFLSLLLLSHRSNTVYRVSRVGIWGSFVFCHYKVRDKVRRTQSALRFEMKGNLTHLVMIRLNEQSSSCLGTNLETVLGKEVKILDYNEDNIDNETGGVLMEEKAKETWRT